MKIHHIWTDNSFYCKVCKAPYATIMDAVVEEHGPGQWKVDGLRCTACTYIYPIDRDRVGYIETLEKTIEVIDDYGTMYLERLCS